MFALLTRHAPPPLITLTQSLKGEEVVTKAVLGQNLDFLLDVCNAFPHSAPSKPSLEKPLADCLDWHRSDVEAGAKRKWAKDEPEKLAVCWRYAWANCQRGPSSRCYALNRLKSCFESSTRLTSATIAATEIIGDDSDALAEDEDEDEAEDKSPHEHPCSVAKVDVGDVVVGEATPKAQAVAPKAQAVAKAPAPLRRVVSKQILDPVSISDSPPTKCRRYINVEELLPPPAKAAAKAQAVAKAPAASSSAVRTTSTFLLPPPAHVCLTPPRDVARDVTPPRTPGRRPLKDRIRRIRTSPPPGKQPSSPAFDSTKKSKPPMKTQAKKKKSAKANKKTSVDTSSISGTSLRNFVECAADKKWGPT